MSILKVFVSSTVYDLTEHIEQASNACVRLQMLPIHMGQLPSSSDEGAGQRLSEKLVDEADIYLGIIGVRYGHCIPESGISYVEHEYNCAVRRGIPRLMFIADESHQFPDSLIETGERANKLMEFKKRVRRENQVKAFGSPLGLYGEIVASLINQVVPESSLNLSSVHAAAREHGLYDYPHIRLDFRTRLQLWAARTVAVIAFVSICWQLFGVDWARDRRADWQHNSTVVVSIGLIATIIEAGLWAAIQEIRGWRYWAGGGKFLPVGESAVFLSLSITIPLTITPLLYQWLTGHAVVQAARHLVAMPVCLVGGAIGHLAMYGTDRKNFTGIRRWIGGEHIRTDFATTNVSHVMSGSPVTLLMFQEAVYTLVYFATIVLPYLAITSRDLFFADNGRLVQMCLAMLFFLAGMWAYIVTLYPASLDDPTGVHFRGIVSGILLMIAYCAAMYM